jgi:hypothetical protein
MPAYYCASFSDFEGVSDSEVIGTLTIQNSKSRFPLEATQIDAWQVQLPYLRTTVHELKRQFKGGFLWSVLLEYPIPLLGDRIDCVLLCGDLIAVIEFKTGIEPSTGAVRQVEDYVLGLANFHEGSAGAKIVPVVASGRNGSGSKRRVRDVWWSNLEGLSDTVVSICSANEKYLAIPRQADEWNRARFKPIPPIIDAAVSLYEGKDIFELEHACAPVESLNHATDSISRIVKGCLQSKEKAICFVTGVPGAGKTLVGLNTVHHSELKSESTFLSGNGPLIKVIREALVRDARTKRKLSKAAAMPEIEAFIHNVHRFAEQYYENEKPPVQSTIVFDEAQRAWDRAENLKRFDRDKSEPEMLLEIMDRRENAVIVALVGGGQEINSGEAGLAEWGRALQGFPKWRVFASPEVLAGGSSTAGFRLFESVENPVNAISPSDALHLTTNLRSIRGQFVSDWVNCLVGGKLDAAAQLSSNSPFPIFVTRDLATLRSWLVNSRRGSEKAGLVGSASAARLRADGLEYSFAFHKDFDWENWFLDLEDDARSCNRLEVFATQFEIQGLELDWVGMCWSEDFVFKNGSWQSNTFRNKGWKALKDPVKQQYRLNAYRVLLTRARKGFAIYVPQPPRSDTTRLHDELEHSYRALLQAGAKPLVLD